MTVEGSRQRSPSTATVAFSEALALVTSQRPGPGDARGAPAIAVGMAATGGGPGAGPSVPGLDAGTRGDEAVTRECDAGRRWSRGAIGEAHRRMATGDLTAAELVEEAIVAAEKEGPALGAVVELMADEARRAAAELDRRAAAGLPMGPLHGIPITVKDIIDVAGVPTRAGSAAYYDVPTLDAVAVARARAAGAVILAKVATHEFALGVTTPQCANPYDHERIPGGSSGGSAIAVACGIGLASIGTDTRASIRVPAALCGVVGLKGSHGLVPTVGIVPLSWTMDHVAPMAATVADAVIMLEVMAGRTIGLGPAGLGAAGLGPAGLGRAGAGPAGLGAAGLGAAGVGPAGGPSPTIGVPSAAFEGCQPDIAAVIGATIDRLVDRGDAGGIVELERPDAADLDLANATGLIVSRCEAAAFHRSLGADRSAYWDEVADQLDAADHVTATDYLDALRLRARLVRDLSAVFSRCDVICLPTVGVAPPLRSDFTRFLTILSRGCVPWSLVGFPVISVPCGFDSSGFPVGLQIVGPPGADATVVAVAAEVESGRRL